MNREEAVRRARGALDDWHKWYAKSASNHDWYVADALRDLLAVEAPLLTEDMVRDVRTLRDYCATFSCPDVLIRILAWFDAHFPLVQHKPCPWCGETSQIYAKHENSKRYSVARCLNCEAEGPPKDTVELAWAAWDRRVEGGKP